MTAKELLLAKYPEVAERETFIADGDDDRAYFNTLRLEEALEKADEDRYRVAEEERRQAQAKKQPLGE